MSRWSGRCDLYDYMSGLGGWFTEDGQPVKFGEGTGPYYSDEQLDFEAFKKETNGTLYQVYKIEVTENNQDFVKEHSKGFSYSTIPVIKEDKRLKSGKRVVNKYVYTYNKSRFTTLKSLNEYGVEVEVEIKFDTLLDLIPYYPYLIRVASCSNGKRYVRISNESYVDHEFKEHLQHGWISEIDYKKELQKHYLDVCRDIFLKDIDERTKVVEIENLVKFENGNYYYQTRNEIDYMHDIEYVWDDGTIHTHWTSPIKTDTNLIELAKDDVEYYLANDIKNKKVKLKYVERLDDIVNVK